MDYIDFLTDDNEANKALINRVKTDIAAHRRTHVFSPKDNRPYIIPASDQQAFIKALSDEMKHRQPPKTKKTTKK